MEVGKYYRTDEYLSSLKDYIIKQKIIAEGLEWHEAYNSGRQEGYTQAMDEVLKVIDTYLSIYRESVEINKIAPATEENVKDDPVNHPSHYTDGKIEVISFIEDKGLIEGFCKGNAIKYISRAGKKESAALQIDEKEIQDLKKARWYLDYLIGYYERKKGEK